MFGREAAFSAGVALLVLSACQQNPVVYDGFETGELSGYWERTKFLPGAVQIQSAVVRAGGGAARITLRPGDEIPQDRGAGVERAELSEPERLWSVEDAAYEYSFSLFVPPDFPITAARLVVAQWKQDCPGDTCAPDNPTLAIRFQSGELVISRQVSVHREILYRTRDDIRNRWLDFRFQIRFSRDQSGRIKVWLDDRMIVDYAGATAYPPTDGYAGPGLFYFKMGLYRDRMPETMTIWFDEYRKQKLDALAP